MSQNVTAAEIREIARTISVLADGYAKLADEMESTGLLEFDGSGFNTLKTATIMRLEGALDRNVARFHKQLRKVSTVAQVSNVEKEIEKEAQALLDAERAKLNSITERENAKRNVNRRKKNG